MKQLDTYYKALLEYKRIAGSNVECDSFLHAFSDADAASEGIELLKTVCTVDEDWVSAIEGGLIHIENAINENRQFILSKGEVLPIEKVKTVSVESVKHLAKHSNLISRPPVNNEIIPDSLYAVERLNDYTVYENRFLYMLLSYLRDFISVRQDKIVAFSHKYEGALTLNKSLNLNGRYVSYSIDLKEKRLNDSYLKEHNENKEIIDRISLAFRTVLTLLSTPLMEDAAKAPMIKPPITKTNILKMDKHFKGAVELYDFIMAYDKQGYTIKEERQLISPFDSDLSEDIACVCAALSFLTYQNALDLRAELAQRHKKQVEHQKVEEVKRYRNQINQIKEKVQNGELEAEEYILALEEKFDALQKAYLDAEVIAEKLSSAESEIAALRSQNAMLDAQNKELDEALEMKTNRHGEEIEAVREKYMQELIDAEADYSQKVSLAQEEHLTSLNAARASFDKELAQIRLQLEQALKEKEAYKKAYAKAFDGNLATNARLKAALSQNGTPMQDCTEKEKFDQLEREYKAFTRLYKRQWKLAKREIERKLLNIEALKGQKGGKDE